MTDRHARTKQPAPSIADVIARIDKRLKIETIPKEIEYLQKMRKYWESQIDRV